MAAMIVACLFCAYKLWTTDTIRDWVLVGLMNIAMIGLHLPMTGGSHHHRSTSVAVDPTNGALVMAATGLAMFEFVLAVTVLLHRTRRYQGRLVDMVDGKV